MRFFISSTAVVLWIAVLAAGCKVGPTHSIPEVPLGTAWAQPLEAGLQPSMEVEQAWWMSFNDPVLQHFIDKARTQNFTVIEATARIQETRAQRGVARGGLFPSVDATASYTRLDISDKGSPFGLRGFGVPPYDLWSAGFDSSWEIDMFGAVRRTMEAASADIEASVEARNDVLVTLVAEVAATYINIRTLEQRILVAKDNVRIQEETLRISDRRFRAGAVSELDVAQAQSNLSRTRSAIPLLERSLQQAKNRLCVLQGELPHDLSAELVRPAPIPQAPEHIAIGMPVDLLRQRPDIRGAERQLAAQAARIGVAAADLYPRLSLTGTFTVDSTKIDSWFTGDSIAYRAGPALRWNILNYGRVRSNIVVQKARWEQAVARYHQEVLTAVSDVEDALAGYQFNRQAAFELQQSVEAAGRAARTAEIQYREGATGFQNLLDAQRFQAQLQDTLVATYGDVSLSLVALYKALGGGWPCSPAPQLVEYSTGLGVPEAEVPPEVVPVPLQPNPAQLKNPPHDPLRGPPQA